MRSINRRDFLHDSAAAAAALAGAGIATDAATAERAVAAAKKGQLNDQLRVAVIGVNGRGMSHVDAFAGNNKFNTIITTVCDADSGVIGRAMKSIEKRQGQAPKFEQDIRKVVEDKNIDIISIATPNHWHALAAIWAHAERQGRLRREAGQPQRQRRPAHRRGRPQKQPHLPDRHAEPQRARACARRWLTCTPASSARSSWRAVCATSSAPASARWTGHNPSPDRSTTTCGAAPRRKVPLHAQATALRLALGLGHRQRRPRQPGHSRDGQGALGAEQAGTGRKASSASAAASATSMTARPPTRRYASSTTAIAS